MPIFVSRPRFLWKALPVLLVAWSGLLAGPWAVAQNSAETLGDWLYEVDQYIPDQEANNRLAAAQRSLLRVLTRTTGLVSVPRTPVIVQALKQPERYYSRYVYFNPSAVGEQQRQRIDNAPEDAAQADLAIRFSFQAQAIKQLLRQATLPSWWSRRPASLAWIVLDTAQGRTVLDSNAVDFDRVLQRAAAQRGLPVLLPTMDLQDSVLVTPTAVWGKFTDVLDQASARYQVPHYLVGRFSVQEVLGQRFYTGEWLVRSGNTEDSRFLRGVDFDEVARTGVDMAAQQQLDRHLVFARTVNQHDVVVTGVDGLAAYVQLLNYLQSLEFVDAVTLLDVRGDALALGLQSVAGPEQLKQLLLDDGRFQFPASLASTEVSPDQVSDHVAEGKTAPGSQTLLQWRPDS